MRCAWMRSKRRKRLSKKVSLFKVGICEILYAPTGTRTPVLALRGPRPGPLDDGGVFCCESDTVSEATQFYHAPPAASTNLETRQVHLSISAQDQRRIVPAETERVGQGHVQVGAPRPVGGVVQVAGRVRGVQVDGRRDQPLT